MPTTSGPLLQALDALWAKLRADHSELPAAQIAVSPLPPRADHGPERWVWVDEGIVSGLIVSAETLAAGPEAVATFLRHEAAHLLCWRRDVKDTTMRGSYHNASYLAVAEEVGLQWPEGMERVKGRGYSVPELTPESAAAYSADMEALGAAIPLVLPHLAVAATASQPRRSRITLECGCRPVPRRIQVAPTVAELGGITCDVCGQPFKA
ncbi:hypothetical protein [Streptomyces sp. NPDC059753]|uniref:hypothetical protein n=1 Tax=Streptomyces sp. NPDC059753 TaxID=3346933 RepID=UPI003646D9A1